MGRPGVLRVLFGMKWRVVLELVGADGPVGVHEVSGRAAVAGYEPRMIGLAEGKHGRINAEGGRSLAAIALSP
jgi:hypothetical protein